MKHSIITCPQWGAKPSNEPIQWTAGPAKRIIIHHTAGHHPEIAHAESESRQEAMQYARAIQRQHMGQGWIDSGHNFLVCRNGLILQGRWRSVRAILARRMVHSAHCPGQNDQIGIEHEHLGAEEMTREQKDASAWLIAWISAKYGLAKPLPLEPHSAHFATACPANLKDDIPALRRNAQAVLLSQIL